MDHRKDQPSVKLHHAPGGQSNFSLAWDDGSQGAAKKQQTAQVTSPFATHEESKAPATSVKVHHAPGGTTSIQLGDGSANQATVPSVKLHHAPGGSTSISFGDGSSSFQTSSQAASQQVGASALPTNTQQPEAAGKRNAQPPGGRSQITF
jgi:hypothetical protein